MPSFLVIRLILEIVRAKAMSGIPTQTVAEERSTERAMESNCVAESPRQAPGQSHRSTVESEHVLLPRQAPVEPVPREIEGGFHPPRVFPDNSVRGTCAAAPWSLRRKIPSQVIVPVANLLQSRHALGVAPVGHERLQEAGLIDHCVERHEAPAVLFVPRIVADPV